MGASKSAKSQICVAPVMSARSLSRVRSIGGGTKTLHHPAPPAETIYDE
jgi:hypothetical protein